MMPLLAVLLQDWDANPRNPKSRLVLALFRLAQAVRRAPRGVRWLGAPYLVGYRIGVEWLLGIELPWNTQIGTHLTLFHGQALVVNDQTVIGTHCTLRHATTIGHKRLPDGSFSACPRIGDHVDIGSNVVLLGAIQIGDHAVIGAGAVVTKDVPPYAVVVGNPARVLRIASPDRCDGEQPA